MSRTPWTTRITAGALLACVLFANAAGAQAPAAQQPPPSMVAAVLSAERSGEPFTLTYFNRPIVVLRASVLGRPPAQRAAIAVQVLDDLVAARSTDPVESRTLEGGAALIFVGSRVVVGLAPPDNDDHAGENIEGDTQRTV